MANDIEVVEVGDQRDRRATATGQERDDQTNG
jgi:hypothetical protein